MRQIIINSFEETRKLGTKLAKSLKGGAVVALHGDLGSGKTTFVQGFAKGLGIEKNINSPTFIIMRSYVIPDVTRNPGNVDSRIRGNDGFGIKMLYHVDLYRIESEHDVKGLGLLELIDDPSNIVVIEWPEKIEHLLPDERIDIFFEYLEDDKRKIVFRK